MRFHTMCVRCAHYSDDEGEPYCEAFGGRPPDEILMEGYDHRQPYPGDNGITFTPDGPVDVKWLEGFSASNKQAVQDPQMVDQLEDRDSQAAPYR